MLSGYARSWRVPREGGRSTFILHRGLKRSRFRRECTTYKPSFLVLKTHGSFLPPEDAHGKHGREETLGQGLFVLQRVDQSNQFGLIAPRSDYTRAS